MSIKVNKAKPEPHEDLWDEHFYTIELPEHKESCAHYFSAFGEHCTCGALKAVVD